MSPGLRTAVYALFVLGVLLGYLPWQLLRLDAALGESLDILLTYVGALLVLIGAALLFSGTYYLVLRGEGTPVPFDSTKRLVVAGPYAHVQHPIAFGLLTMAFAEALWFHSPSLGVYTVFLAVVINLYLT